MCGLVISEQTGQASSMLQRIAHRGPDAQTVVTYGGLEFGHARLSIVDVATGSQPLIRNNCVSMFNGEVFNYKDLASRPDQTEVEVLHDLARGGDKPTSLGNQANGYYAYAFYDSARSTLRVYRDTFGVVPVYYLEHPTFAVASELKAFPEYRHLARPVPPNGLIEYNTKTKKLKVRKWPLPFFRTSSVTIDDLLREFRKALTRVISHTDSGYSLALSGGLDSSMILAGIQHWNLPRPREVISVYLQKGNAELDRARTFVTSIGLQDIHKVVPIDIEPNLRYWIETEPNTIRDFAFYRHATVAKHCTSKVLVCGEGADELGLGYPITERLNNPAQLFAKKMGLLKSQSVMTLDRVNKAGMKHSVEYRVPFLDLGFVQCALQSDQLGKSDFRRMAQHLGVPDYIVNCPKFSTEEIVGRV